ncbi:50S ribosomal protein L25 [Candidatus Gracilibacteria bacterium]|nr:50S ribosomal protein L25 [Candidatus Gracilibacteria bacterium]
MKLTVQLREETGKNVKRIRKDGLVPAVVYGKMLETPVLLKCVKNDFIRVYRTSGYSTPIELTGAVDQLVLLHAMQLDPVTDEVLSLDFLAVDKHQKVTANVPVVLVGESTVEKLNQGKIQLVKDSVEVSALPQDLPHEIEVDLSKVTSVNDVIFVRDLTVAKKVEIVDDAQQPVVTVVELEGEEESQETTPAAE